MSKVLIVIDMQNDFITGALGSAKAQAIVPRVVNLIKDYKAFAQPVFFTQDTHHSDYAKTLEGQRLPVPHCLLDSEGWELHKDIIPFVDNIDNVLLKPSFGTLLWREREDVYNTLEEADWIEVCGLCTDICVLNNVAILRALFPDTVIKVRANACAGSTPERHKAALEVMKSLQIDVIEEKKI